MSELVETELPALWVRPAKITLGKLPSCIIGGNTQSDDEESRQYYEAGEKRAVSYKNQVTLVTSEDGSLTLVDNIYRVDTNTGEICRVDSIPNTDDEIKNYLENCPNATIKNFTGIDQEIDRHMEHNESRMSIEELLMFTKHEGEIIGHFAPASRYGWTVYYFTCKRYPFNSTA